ncbi:MAG TPA: 23S rRNA (guanosine(2251)-2'-O)-methyltransferase RlmB [Saprospiraceae bacterium]|nr:23S rRNA (guanosine(2251)-2'-O)-methyltransferase RlmB [Saprospiraceae bacterium]
MSDISKDLQIIGKNPVLEAIHDGKEIERVYLLQGTTGDFEKALRHLCRTKDIPMQIIPKERMFKVNRGNNQGVVAILPLVQYYKIEDVIAHCYENGKVPLILLLDSVTDVRNLGGIARSAVSYGVDAIVVPTTGSAPIQSDSVKASAGALLKIQICRVPSLVNTVEYLQESGLQVYATNLEARESIEEIDLKVPLAIIIGSEDDGVSPHLLRAANRKVKIPQLEAMESLNVSVATGIVLYEVFKQRR